MNNGDMESRLHELETRQAFQDDLIEKLDAVVTRQNLEVMRLTEMVREMKAALKEVATSAPGSSETEAPPHY